ncbi:hypothetical protein [Vreelandella titanicae]|uniref:hypothetical protein n=1 Tax=Vreelandella titanicae TaxID=664683 RepID=UPI0016804EDC|nr:hypothetical protein [Halomonas titanicae]QNU63290.1 hypothetical protein HZS52_02660 [Halomonas titanicae]
MGLSPWSVAPKMDCWEVACILAGYEPSEVDSLLKHGPELNYQVADVFAWEHQIVEAVGRGDLKAESLMVYRYPIDDEHGDRTTKRWCSEPVGDVGFLLTIFKQHELKMQLQRLEVYRWLKASGVTDNDIPKNLQLIPKLQDTPEPYNKPLHARRRQTYLTLIEALMVQALGEIPDEPYKTAGRLEVILESHGLTLNKEPIAETIREIQKAREERDP